MIVHVATVEAASPRVVVSWSGGEMTLRPSETLAHPSLQPGDQLLVVQADNGDFYAFEYIGV